MGWYRPTTLLDKFFVGGLIIKGVTSLAEFISGLLLLFINPAQIHQLIVLATQRELLEDPRDKVANFLLDATSHISTNGRIFLITYLWIHALIKLTAIIGLLQNRRWAYSFSLSALGLLMAYQLYMIFFIEASIGMILLTIFDALILWLIWREYKKNAYLRGSQES